MAGHRGAADVRYIALVDQRTETRVYPGLLREQRLHDRALALTESLREIRRELDQTASQIRVAHLSLERAQGSRAWRFGHGVTKFLAAAMPGRRVGGADAFDSAMATLAALERDHASIS